MSPSPFNVEFSGNFKMLKKSTSTLLVSNQISESVIIFAYGSIVVS